MFHLPGMAGLLLFGTIDIITVIKDTINSFSYTLLGILLFVAMTTYAFTERLTQLINERKKILDELKVAYKDLESASTLKQIGQSTAIINHEIKNYMFVISGNAQLLKKTESLTDKGNKMVEDIIDTSDHMVKFTKDILDLSKSEIIRDKDKKCINLSEVVINSISKHFQNKADYISLIGFDIEHFIYGDWAKIDHVFLNMLNNAFEAKAETIKINLIEQSSIICLSVEDDGEGFSGNNLEEIFNAFYTTKKQEGGTGLGLSITRAIIESHGGHISVYIKDSFDTIKGGLKFNITFPAFKTTITNESIEKDKVILIKEGIEDIKELFRIFQNVHFNPHIIQEVSDLVAFKDRKDITVILANTRNAVEAKQQYQGFSHICILKQYQKTFYIIDRLKNSQPEIFSEEYILSNFK